MQSTLGADMPSNQVSLTVVSANVQSLRPVDLRSSQLVGYAYNEKMRQLDSDFHSLGVDLIGVQESCVQGAVKRQQPNFTAYTSGAFPGGTHGCESWVSNDLLRTNKAAAAAYGPRLLVVTIRGNMLVKHVVAHAPISSDPADARAAFWDKFDQVVCSIPPT
jgi:hypothetical protein